VTPTDPSNLLPLAGHVHGPVRLTDELRTDGAARLGGVPPRERAGDRRTLEAYAELGVSLDWMWGTTDVATSGGARVRHCCLIVPSSGRTAMTFVTAPDPGSSLGPIEDQINEIARCLASATDWISTERGDEVHLLQALPHPDDHHIIDACERAGFQRLGGLIYLSGRIAPRGRAAIEAREPSAPAGIEVRTVRAGDGGFEADRPHLLRVLERSYEQTLDCPELCGLRDTPDVLESHRHAGVFDPTLWFLAFQGDRPVGCALYAPARGSRAVELVYLGVAPEVRVRGLASHLLAIGIDAARRRSCNEITCAVDARNVPALRLYARAGMSEVGRRVALVRGTFPNVHHPSRSDAGTSQDSTA
jgi:ribosomal protein S18 acetylase RimI-like enzyme